MEKKFVVWSGISLFVLTLAVAGCERGEREEGGDRDRDEQVAPPSGNPGAGTVAPAPSGSDANPGVNYGKTPPAEKQ